MDLILLFNALMRRKWVLIAVPIISVAAAFVLTIGYKKLYKSGAQLSTGFTVREEVSLKTERFNVFEADVKFNNLLETITSPRVFGLLAYKLLLHDLDTEKPAFRIIEESKENEEMLSSINEAEIKKAVSQKLDSLDFLSTYNENDRKIIDLLKLYEYDYESLRKSISINRVGNTDYISIYSFTENPDLSAYMVNTLCDEFLRYNALNRSAKSVQSVQTFANLVNQKKNELDQKSEALRRFKSSNRVLNFEMESSSMITQIADFENLREEKKREINGLGIEIRELERKIADLGNTPSRNSNLSNAEIVKLRKKISELNERYLESGADNSILKDSIQILRGQLRSKLSRLSSNNTNTDAVAEDLISKRDEFQIQLDIAQENLRTIEDQLRILKSAAGGYASKEAMIAALEREVNTATQEYLQAQEKYNTALDLALASSNTIEQTLIGQPAVDPEPSKRVITMALSGVSSFVLCALVIILLEYLDVSIKTPANFQKISRLRLMGSLNKIDLKKTPIQSLFSGPLKKKDHRIFRENLKKLRFEIENSKCKVFLFTSTRPGEGKSTIIQALSSAIALSKRKVLIVDTNFPNNSVTKGYKAKPALEEVVNNGEAGYERAITKTKNQLIDIVGCKSGGYSPSEVFPDGKFRKMLASFAKSYDYIFLEGPSINLYSDSKELAPYAEAVVAVFSANSSIKVLDKESIKYLSALRGRFLGSILNMVEPENQD